MSSNNSNTNLSSLVNGFSSQKSKELIELSWEGILRNINLQEKKESTIKYLNKFKATAKDEAKSGSNGKGMIEFILKNKVFQRLCEFTLSHKELLAELLDSITVLLKAYKFKEDLFTSNEGFLDKLENVVLYLEDEFDKEGMNYKYKNEFSLLLNHITRVLLNYPGLVKYFVKQKQNKLTNDWYEDYSIFTCLLKLHEIDHFINPFDFKKYIRRSLIVFMSIDELMNSRYLQESIFIEIIVNKLINYYQMLPETFNFIEKTNSLEAGINIHLSFHCLCPIFFEFTDFATFINKIANCFSVEGIKKKFKYYFFNKFLVENLQPNLLSKNPKISRTHFQYLIALLYYSKNNIIIDSIIDFLFGFSEIKISRKFDLKNRDIELSPEDLEENNNNKDNEILEDPTSDFDYGKHEASHLCLKVLRNIGDSEENLNIITYMLLKMFFMKRPYIMMRRFIKPFTDFVFKKMENPNKFQNTSIKAFPFVPQLINLFYKYKQYDTSDISGIVETNIFNSFNYYINYDIDFYMYYVNQKQESDEMDLGDDNNVIGNGNNANNESLLEKNMISGLSPLKKTRVNALSKKAIKNITKKSSFLNTVSNSQSNSSLSNNNLNINQNSFSSKNNNYSNNIKNNINCNCYNGLPRTDSEIIMDSNLFESEDDKTEEFVNMNFLLMKNIVKKLVEFFHNNNLENVFLINLVMTIISVPVLQFDPELVQSSYVLLDDDDSSKYSLITIFKYISQEILKKLSSNKNDENAFKELIKVYNVDKYKIQKEQIMEREREKMLFKDKKMNALLLSKGRAKDEIFNEKDKYKIEITNWIIFCEFVKVFLSSISYKHIFEGTVENIYEFYSEQLDEYYNNDEEEEEKDE